MAFTDFKTIADVQKAYNIKYLEENFIEYSKISLPPFFLEELEFNRQNIDVFSSEASRCENVIYPVLREVYKQFVEKYALWSHKSLSYDQKLNGTPDYIFSTKSELGKTVLGHPLIMIVEAKQNNFNEGWGQCLAELVAAQRLNENQSITVYGIVTDGELWQFGSLRADVFTRHKTRMVIDELEELFGAITFVLTASAKYDFS
ncbi:MAG: hypothetical protein GY754_45160 [bacterium]|nr:hypothetical protein [bacterium]